ncbi:MAG: prepilin-type N-terminal cleavage/methylation domain-containing protein [Planctomycetota bacterium]|nr:prepilin-type N-terminal cleavage/methylation domain-containing protein [Planctomycetota bacterium]
MILSFGQPNERARTGETGFTLIEIMVTMVIMGLLVAMVAPSLDAYVPKSRLDSAAKVLAANLDMVRSEAKIQSKPYTVELDLKHARWRRVFPPEQRLTTDQELWTIESQNEDWNELGDDVVFAGAGSANLGLARDGMYKVNFDVNGFTSDQVIMLHLLSDPKMIWSIQFHGITGRAEILTNFEGTEHPLEEVGEGGF